MGLGTFGNTAGHDALSPVILGNPTMEKQKGSIGLMLGALVAVVAFAFIVTGGTYGGKKTVDGDEDLPPVATGTTKK
jgi:hypothetical protein